MSTEGWIMLGACVAWWAFIEITARRCKDFR